jgi:phosphoribosylamine--glycine ligase
VNILVIDAESIGLDFSLRCQEAGHNVRWFVDSQGEVSKEGEGLVLRVESWIPHMKWADLIFLTGNSKYLNQLEPYRKRDFPIFGPSVASADLEINRALGMKTLKDCGIDVPEYKTFKTLKDAEKHVWKTGERYVFKTLGDNEDKSLSYCSKSASDMISRLRRWQEMKMNPKGEVMLQEFIEGIEMGVSGWFGPGGFSPWWNENFEFKKFLSGDKGPNTGEMGTVMQYTKKSKLADEVMKPITQVLHDLNHTGDVDVNVIIDKSGKVWPLEFTARPGWPAFFIQMASHTSDPANWMLDLIKGQNSLTVKTDVAVGIVITQPKFPYSKKPGPESDGIPIYGMKKVLEKLHLVGVRWGKGVDGDPPKEQEMYLTSGEYIMCAVDFGKTVSEAAKAVYKVVDEISLPNMIIRDDIGERLEKQLPLLHKSGFATGFNY